MRKEVFLEYKFGDYNLEILKESGADGLIVWLGNLTQERWQELQELEMKLGLAFNAFNHGTCPLNPEVKSKLEKRLKQSLSFDPEGIWLDHFRFDGYWEGIKDGQIPGLHRECQWCQGKDRASELAKIAKWIKLQIPEKVELGYFAVPFKNEEVPELVSSLGQDHRLLGKIFAISSPMLYHRMIGKPVTYIAEYVRYLASLSKKLVLPIIQVKDMPDDLPDRLDQKEMSQAFQEAIKPPSVGVAWFSWDGAVEKSKTQLIKRLFHNSSD